MSNFVENITEMSEGDLKAWCLQQVSSDTCVSKRIAEANILLKWLRGSSADASPVQKNNQGDAS